MENNHTEDNLARALRVCLDLLDFLVEEANFGPFDKEIAWAEQVYSDWEDQAHIA